MFRWREFQTEAMKDRFQGVILTVWSGAAGFIDGLENYMAAEDKSKQEQSQPWVTFVQMFDTIDKISTKYEYDKYIGLPYSLNKVPIIGCTKRLDIGIDGDRQYSRRWKH
jgi:hypothetical protein